MKKMSLFGGARALAAAVALAAMGPALASDAAAQFMPSEAQFTALFPARLGFYTHDGFLKAARSFPAFAGTGDELQRRREMAAFLGNIAHESDELRALREYRRENHDRYCSTDEGERCAPGQQYYGRGPIQLSWNYQYRRAGEAIGLDLWGDPDLVARDASVAWQTAIWYWMTQKGPGSMTPHQAMTSGPGFGETVRSINGVIECDKPADRDAARKIARRVDFFKRAAQLFDVPPGPNLGC
jgi:hypothetical protein